MKIGLSGFYMPVSNRCTAFRRGAVFKKSPILPASHVAGKVLPWVLPDGARRAVVSTHRCFKCGFDSPRERLPSKTASLSQKSDPSQTNSCLKSKT